MIASIVIISIVTLISLGLTGQLLTFYNGLYTKTQRNNIYDTYPTFINSINSIMAFNIIQIPIMTIFIYSTF
jgi:hypothetical protein